jgi:hypothetical protein
MVEPMTKQQAFEFLAGELDGWLENEDDNIRSYGAAYLPGSGWDLADVDEADRDHVAEEVAEFTMLQTSLDILNDENADEDARVVSAGDVCEVLDRGIMQNLRDDAPFLSPEEALRYAQYQAACEALGFPV